MQLPLPLFCFIWGGGGGVIIGSENKKLYQWKWNYKEYFAVTYSLSKKKLPGDDNKLYSINRNNTLEEICMYNMHNIYDR